MRVEYDSNNSGGKWWLSDDNWKALEDAGWVVDWQERRFLGALAMSATRTGLTMEQAVEEFERVTGACATDAGCPCCGTPHSFTEYDDKGKYVRSGPSAVYSAEF